MRVRSGQQIPDPPQLLTRGRPEGEVGLSPARELARGEFTAAEPPVAPGDRA